MMTPGESLAERQIGRAALVGTCPECGSVVAFNKDGRLKLHNRTPYGAQTSHAGEPCPHNRKS